MDQSKSKQSSTIWSIVAGIISIIIFFSICRPGSGPDKSDIKNAFSDFDKRVYMRTAYDMSKEFVKKELLCPSTAKFPGYGDIEVISMEREVYDPQCGGTKSENKGMYKIIGYVDAENTFGAKIRNQYYCEVEYLGNDKWGLIELYLFDE
jgi:hypothetical protein